jgi:hypothetical protein
LRIGLAVGGWNAELPNTKIKTPGLRPRAWEYTGLVNETNLLSGQAGGIQNDDGGGTRLVS